MEIYTYCDTYHVLLQVGFAGKAETTSGAVKVPLSLVMNCSSVVLQSGFVTEWSTTNVTVKHVSRMGCQHVSGQTSFTCEGRIT